MAAVPAAAAAAAAAAVAVAVAVAVAADVTVAVADAGHCRMTNIDINIINKPRDTEGNENKKRGGAATPLRVTDLPQLCREEDG